MQCVLQLQIFLNPLLYVIIRYELLIYIKKCLVLFFKLSHQESIDIDANFLLNFEAKNEKAMLDLNTPLSEFQLQSNLCSFFSLISFNSMDNPVQTLRAFKSNSKQKHHLVSSYRHARTVFV
jgi:hypothetical protein